MAIVQNGINANSITPLVPTAGGLGVSNPVAHGVIVGEGASPVNSVVLAAGEVLIGTTAGDPAHATLTAGTNITISSVSGSITITANSNGLWVDQTAAAVTMTANTGYTADSATLITFTLPIAANIGDYVEVVGKGAGLWKIAQAASQQIFFGNASSTIGTGGSVASQNQYDAIKLRALTAGATSTWSVVSSDGFFLVT